MLFFILAAGATVAGIAAVAGASWLLSVNLRSRKKLLAVTLLLAYGAALWFRPTAWPFIDLAVVAGALGAVLLIEGGLQTPPAVAMFLAVAAVADYLSVSGGLSRVIIERYRDGTGDLLIYLSLVVLVRGHLIPIVGISDLFIGAAAATALLRLGFRPVAVMGTIAGALLCALAYGFWRGGAPAVPFLAGAVALLVWRHSSRTAAGRVHAASTLRDGCRGAG